MSEHAALPEARASRRLRRAPVAGPFTAATLGFCVLAAACGTGPARESPQDPREATESSAASPRPPLPEPKVDDGGTISWGDTHEPSDLNCIRAGDAQTLRLCRLFADSLIDYDRSLNIVPRLAESFEVSPDGKVLTFHLRRGVTWHDGAPFTSRDVLYSIQQIRAPGAMVRGNKVALFEPLESLEAPDEYTVVSRFREPYALGYQAWVRAIILPAHLNFAPGATTPRDRDPIGTGPYRFVRWDPKRQIVFEANPRYFAGRPHLDRIVYRIVPDGRSLLMGLKSGEIDVAALSGSDAPADDAGFPFRIVRFHTLTLEVILWNIRAPRSLFKDSRVRRAMALAMNRDEYLLKVREGNDLPAVSSFHPLTWAHDPALAALPHDPNLAAALLAEAGWSDHDGDGILDTPSGPASFTLLFRATWSDHEKLGTLFKAALKPLGIEVRLQGLEGKIFSEKTQGHAFDAATFRWGLDLDPDPFDFFHSSQYASGQNYGGYANAEVDRIAEEGRRTMDVRTRAGLYQRVERILRDEQPFMFIAHPGTTVGIARRLHGVEPSPAGLWNWFRSTHDWWIPEAEQRLGR